MRILFLRGLLATVTALGGALISPCSADEVAFDDFETVPMVPFDEANVSIGDGTDWTEVIPGWTILNDVNHVATDADAYNGWRAMDVNSWIAEQGVQAGRDRAKLSVENNTALVADPDAWDDYPPGGKDSQGFNSYVSHTVDITGRDLATLAVSFDWDFVTEDRQIGVVDVSFDGGTTYQNLVTIASADWIGDATWGAFAVADQLVYSTNPLTYTVEPTQKVFVSGVDFAPPAGATAITIRFGCILSGNDWWFSVDNVQVSDSVGVIELEDFESVVLKPFPEGGVGEPPGDGTDYSNMIPNWVILNEGTSDFPTKQIYNISLEGAYNGFAAVDTTSWINEQGGTNGAGGQSRDTLLGSGPGGGFPARNIVLLADPDGHNDYPEANQNTPPTGEKEYNSFIQREYDLSFFRNTTVVVEFDWETRVESNQRALAQVSFDYGETWTTILDVDSDDQAKLDALAPFSFGSLGLYGSYTAPTQFPFGPPGSTTATAAKNSNSMILRFGCIDADNNWWYAVDNVRVSADPQAFAMGDANADGMVNNLDIGGFITALTNKAGFDAGSAVPADQLFDFNADGVFNNLDIGGFLTELRN